MPNDIIDLLEDSDDDVPLSNGRCSSKSVVAPTTTRQVITQESTCIDLCGSSSDEENDNTVEDKVTSTKFQQNKCLLTNRDEIIDVDSGDESSVVLKVLPKKCTDETDETSRKLAPSSAKKHVNDSFATDKIRQQQNTCVELSDDDDDDGLKELLAMGPSFKRQTQGHTKTIKVSPYSKAASMETPWSQSTKKFDLPTIKTTSMSNPEVAHASPGLGSSIGNPYKTPSKVSSVIVNPYKKKSRSQETPGTAATIDTRSSDDDCLDLDESCVGPIFSNRKRPRENKLPSKKSTHTAGFGSPTNATVVTMQATNRIPQEFSYPTLLHNSKTYDDLRAQLALALWRSGRRRTTNAHELESVDRTTKSLMMLVLGTSPIRSIEEYLAGGRSSITVNDLTTRRDRLRSQLESVGFSRIVTPPSSNKDGYYTITEACLVAMLDHVRIVQNGIGQNMSLEDVLKHKSSWISLKKLIPLIDARLRRGAPSKLTCSDMDDYGASHYLNPSTRSVEWLQIHKLGGTGDEVGNRIKYHKQNGEVCFELLKHGYDDALYIKSRMFPGPKGHYRTSQRICTRTYRNICLGVDRKEGGGQWILHEMCNTLDKKKVPYFVGSLAIGDYVFFTSKPGSSDRGLEYLCPIIIERKSIQDVAHSIHDNRWTTQKLRMYKGQYLFGYDNCRLVYIIEGNQQRQQLTGGLVGKIWHNVPAERLQKELDNLQSEGFEVIRTPSRENTMFELCRWAERIAQEIEDRSLQVKYTYAEFKKLFNEIPSDTDFSRIAKDHAQQKQAENEVIEVVDLPLKAADKCKVESAKKQKRVQDEEFSDKKVAELKQMCKSVGLSTTGSRDDLIARYNGPHPPKVWLRRKNKGQYVPSSYNVGGTALLVALYLHERSVGEEDRGLVKDELYVKAEELCISKNPFSGGITQTGPYHYDGWSNMKFLLNGDPALVILSKKRYKLTRSCDLAGFAVAEAMHRWCHQHGNCPCGADLK